MTNHQNGHLNEYISEGFILWLWLQFITLQITQIIHLQKKIENYPCFSYEDSFGKYIKFWNIFP